MFEQLSYFDLYPSNANETSYTAYCYCQDIYGAITKINSTWKVQRQDPEVAVPLNSLLAGTDFLDQTLNAYQSSNRAEVLKSLAQDIEKSANVTNTTTTLIFPQTNSVNLTMEDPVISDIYCNNRGKAALVDKYLVCDCDPNYIGRNCQILLADYSLIYNNYRKL